MQSQVGLRKHHYEHSSGGDRIPAELFQILRDDFVKVLHLICQHIWKTQQWPQDWKRCIFIPIPKKDNAKEYSNYHGLFRIFGSEVRGRRKIVPGMAGEIGRAVV